MSTGSLSRYHFNSTSEPPSAPGETTKIVMRAQRLRPRRGVPDIIVVHVSRSFLEVTRPGDVSIAGAEGVLEASGCQSAPKFGSDSHPMIFGAECAVLQRGNQHHEDRHPDFFSCAEWVGG